MAKKATSSKSSKKKLTETNHTVDKTIESKNKASINSHPKVSSSTSSTPTNHWLNFLNYLKKSTAAKSAFAVLALLLVLFGATFTINQINNNQDDASAGLVCPNGGTPGGPGGPGYDPNTCYVQTTTSQTTYSCPNGGELQGTNCVATEASTINIASDNSCNVITQWPAYGFDYGLLSNQPVRRVTINGFEYVVCRIGGIGVGPFGTFPCRFGPTNEPLPELVLAGNRIPNNPGCTNFAGSGGGGFNWDIYGPGVKSRNYSYPATPTTTPTTTWTPTGGVTFTPSSPADISSTVCTPENLDRTTGTTTCTVTFNNPSNAPLNLGQGTGNPFTIALTNLARTNTAGQSDGPEIVNNSTARFSNVPTTGTSNGSPLQPADTQVEAQLFQPGVVGLYTGEIITLTSTPTTPATTLTPGTGNVTGTVGLPINPITGLGGNYTGPATVTLPGGQVITGNVGTGGTFTPNPNQPINTNTPIGTGNSTLTPTGPNAPGPITVPTTINPTAQNDVVITTPNIQDSTDCTESKIVIIGETYDCEFPLTGSANNNYVLPPNGIQGYTNTLGNSGGDDCTILDNGTTTARLSCTEIKSEGAGAGRGEVVLLVNGGWTGAKGEVTFVAPATTLTPGTGNVTGTIGQPLTPITGLGGNYTGPATVTLPGGQPITGIVDNGTFTPNPNQPINTNTTPGPNQISTLTPTGPNAPGPITVPTTITAPTTPTNNPTLGNPTATTASPITGTVGQPLPTIPLTGGNLPDGTPATFTPGGSTTPIPGTIQNGNFVPTTGSIIPLDSTTGPTTGTLTSPGTTPVTVPTNFTPATTPATAQQLIDAIDCTPQTVTVGGTIVCDGQLPANTTADNLQVQLQNNGNPVNCTVTTTGAITCPPITTTTPGTNLPITATTTTVTTPATVDTATVSSTPTTAPTIITPTNIGNSTDCTSSQTVTIPNTYTCTFPLIGDPNNNYQLPEDGIRATTETANGLSQECTIVNNNTPQALLRCTQIPTEQGESGIRDVNLAVSCSVSQVSTNNNQNSNTLQKALYAIVTGIPTYAGGDCTTVPRGEVTLQTSFLPPITVRSGGAALAALLAAGGAVGGVLAYRKSQKRKLKVG